MTFSNFSSSTLLAILPEALIVVLALLVLGFDLVWPESRRRGLGILTAVGLALILGVALLFSRPTGDGLLVFGGMIRHDWVAFVFRGMFIFAGAISSLLSLDVDGIGRKGEYYAIMLAAILGMNFMAASADLIMLYLSLETTSIALYMLAGFLREDDASAEAGLKYFLFGSFTSTVMLYGFSLLYGFTGQTNLYLLAASLTGAGTPVAAVALALVLLLVGFGFKVAAVPFHFWTPDVYEGAPTPITAFVSTASKAAGFAVLVRVLLVVFPGIELQWGALIAAIAAATMTLGNVLALAQRNIKSMLAYSSIAHAGYALVGFVAVSQLGVASVIFYLMTYVLTNLAAFAVVVLFARAAGSDQIADYAGLSRRSPGLALAMMVAFLSLAGMPPLAGFFGKFYVFAAAIQGGLIWLAVVGVLNAIVGLYYYLTVLKVVYLYRSENDDKPIAIPRPYVIALAVCSFGILLLGTLSAPWFNWAWTAAGNLF